MAPLRCAVKFDPFLSLDCTPTPPTLVQSKERKGSNFAIWQHCFHNRIYSIECHQSSQLRVGRGLDAAPGGDHRSHSSDSVYGGPGGCADPRVGGAGCVDRILQVCVIEESRVLDLEERNQNIVDILPGLTKPPRVKFASQRL